jgi:uncharacterized protein (TIGR02145 family)
MIYRRVLKIIPILILIFCLYHCKPELFLLNGGINGYVTDSLTSLPVSGSTLILKPLNDSTTTDSTGKYRFINIPPGEYEVLASKGLLYQSSLKNTIVTEARAEDLNFALNGVPSPYFSWSYLDFGFDSTIRHFTISNKGEGILKFSMQPDYFIWENWINIQPSSGEITKEITSVTVSIDRASIPTGEKQEYVWINISDQFQKNYTIPVLANGILDKDLHYYSIKMVGTQTWQAQNLNVGSYIDTSYNQLNNKITEKYCYDNDYSNCDYGGGLYTWSEMMAYAPSDNSTIGTTQAVCPAGWHIPTYKEWQALIDYYGGASVAGDSLKIPDGFWRYIPHTPFNIEALEYGEFDGTVRKFDDSSYATFYSSTEFSQSEAYYIKIKKDSPSAEIGIIGKSAALAVRCVKDLENAK